MVDIDIKVKKMHGFEKRISEIFGIIAPKEEWELQKDNSLGERGDRPAFVNLSRRLLETLATNPHEMNRESLHTLERLLQGRHIREEAYNNNPPRNLNINDIYQHMEEFSAIVPPQPEPEPQGQPMDIEPKN